MLQGVFSYSKHLQHIAAESALNVFEVDVREVVALDLLRGIVDKDVDLSKSVNMLLDSALTCLIIHQVAGDQLTLLAFIPDHLSSFVRIVVLLGKVDDGNISPFPGKNQCYRSADSRAGYSRQYFLSHESV